MAPHESYTRLLGLALKGGNLAAGSDAVQAAAYAGNVRLLLLSADASPRACREAELCAERGACLMVALPCDKAELGGALGRGATAIAALTDTGLAAAVAERLAALDADRYGAIAERLRLKSRRAKERRAAHAHARPEGAKRKAARPEGAKSKSAAPPKDKAPKAATRLDGAERKTARPRKAAPKPAPRPGNAERKTAARPDKANGKPSARPFGRAPAKRGAASGKLRGRPPNRKKPPKP
ncbi:MAG: 50S ribosomal protein L7 [Oscillibacter sp.]|nr:50S ribosomal protein L7 [Oscillibacter sp.]